MLYLFANNRPFSFYLVHVKFSLCIQESLFLLQNLSVPLKNDAGGNIELVFFFYSLFVVFVCLLGIQSTVQELPCTVTNGSYTCGEHSVTC